jgi:hypothetical protein
VPEFFFPQRSAARECRSDVPDSSGASTGLARTNKPLVLALLLIGLIMVTVVFVARWAGAVGVAALGPILRQT